MPPRKRTASNPRSGTRPSTLRPVQEPEFEDFEALLQEANDLRPYRLRISDDEILEIECPTSDDMEAMASAEQTRDTNALAVALFGDHAGRVLELTAGKPFTVLAKLVERVMMHYGVQGANLGE